MKKVLFFLLLISLLISPSYAVKIFGVNFPSTKYGGAITMVPSHPYSFYALTGYYEIGLPVKEFEGLYVMAGPRAVYAFWTGYPASYFSLGLNIDAIYLFKQWSFKLFGLTWYPSLNALLSIDFIRVGSYYYVPPYVTLNLYLGLYTPYGKEKNSYINIYFWPWPIVLGFDMVRF